MFVSCRNNLLSACRGTGGIACDIDRMLTYKLCVEFCQSRLAVAVEDQKCVDHGVVAAAVRRDIFCLTFATGAMQNGGPCWSMFPRIPLAFGKEWRGGMTHLFVLLARYPVTRKTTTAVGQRVVLH